MEHVNASATIRQQQKQQHQQQQQHEQLQQHQEEQQQRHNAHQQQFCLRWHNHQTSLLSTLPVLLDQSHLTDVTISAEGRSLRAHRVVLSACSSFFLEIFRTLDAANHPVIIIPGASFAAIVALLTFMYSGEVNVYEEQIPMLLNLAETLGIKGLADVQHNLQKSAKSGPDRGDSSRKDDSEAAAKPSPPPAAVSAATATSNQQSLNSASCDGPVAAAQFNPLVNTLLGNKLSSPLDNFLLKSLQFYPNFLPQPLNFSQTALNKTTELLAKYQQQCNLYQGALGMTPLLRHDDERATSASATAKEESYNLKRFCSGEKKANNSSETAPSPHDHHSHTVSQQQQQQQQQQQKDIKRIDKIVESLLCSGAKHCGKEAAATSGCIVPPHQLPTSAVTPLTAKAAGTVTDYTSSTSSALTPKHSALYNPSSATQNSPPLHSHHLGYISPEDQAKLQQHLDKYAATYARSVEASDALKTESTASPSTPEKPPTAASPQSKTASNSKLYATCFICHKQLSNQYNLRVHLETHQNVRYACNVCSHVSRSKDALRKHVSYRHPGAPSPCETEARRKRATKLFAATSVLSIGSSTSSGEGTPTAHEAFQADSLNNEAPQQQQQIGSAAQLNSASASASVSAYMFLPNQFHLAAAAAAVASKQQQEVPGNSQSPDTNVATTPTTSEFHSSSGATPSEGSGGATKSRSTVSSAAMSGNNEMAVANSGLEASSNANATL